MLSDVAVCGKALATVSRLPTLMSLSQYEDSQRIRQAILIKGGGRRGAVSLAGRSFACPLLTFVITLFVSPLGDFGSIGSSAAGV